MKRTLDHGTMFGWTAAPFGRIRRVPPFEGARWPSYTRRPIKTAKRRDWTPDEIDELDTLLEAGYSYAHIARRLGRTETAVVVKVKRTRLRRLTKRRTTVTAREVAQLLGLACGKSVSRWITAGMLVARNAGVAPRTIWIVQWEDLLAFLSDDRWWMAWSPTHITDLDLQAWAANLRANEDTWLRIGAVATRLGVTHASINDYINRGMLPAIRYGNWWIRESSLAGFVIPSSQPRKRNVATLNQRPLTSLQHALLDRLRHGSFTIAQMSDLDAPRKIAKAIEGLRLRGLVARNGIAYNKRQRHIIYQLVTNHYAAA